MEHHNGLAHHAQVPSTPFPLLSKTVRAFLLSTRYSIRLTFHRQLTSYNMNFRGHSPDIRLLQTECIFCPLLFKSKASSCTTAISRSTREVPVHLLCSIGLP